MNLPDFLTPSSAAEDALLGIVEAETAMLAEFSGAALLAHAPEQLQFNLPTIMEAGGGTALIATGVGLAAHGVYRYVRAWRNNKNNTLDRYQRGDRS